MTLQDQMLLLVLGQILTIVVLIASNFLNTRHMQRLYQEEFKTEAKIKTQVDYLERQLVEFYGPISAILAAQDLLIRQRWNPDTQTYIEMPEEIWQAIRDEIMIPNAKTIAEIITGKFHLVEGIQVPQSYMDYLAHAYFWPLSVKLQDKVDTESRRYYPFPSAFKADIDSTTNALKSQYYKLIEKRQENSPDSEK
ncbi:MAG: hypothetical protein KJ065_19250 [Anaerolineae bacterium]|nr:hypothetical protein [Anaerolineae bacterium]